MKGHGSQIANLNLFYWDTYRRRVLQRSINLSLPQEDISATRAPQHPLESGYALAQDHAGDETGQKGMLDGRRGVVMRRWGYCGVSGEEFQVESGTVLFFKTTLVRRTDTWPSGGWVQKMVPGKNFCEKTADNSNILWGFPGSWYKSWFFKHLSSDDVDMPSLNTTILNWR